MKKYIVRLTSKERNDLNDIIHKGKAAAYKRLHAQILLKADISEDGPGWKDIKIADAFNISVRTVERVRERLVEFGLEVAINHAASGKSRPHKLDGEKEAYLIALSCSEPPDGRSRWTLRLLASKMIELKHVDSLSPETVRKTLKKTK